MNPNVSQAEHAPNGRHPHLSAWLTLCLRCMQPYGPLVDRTAAMQLAETLVPAAHVCSVRLTCDGSMSRSAVPCMQPCLRSGVVCRSWCPGGSTYLSPLPGPMTRTRWQKQGRTPTQTLRWRVHNTLAAVSCRRLAPQPWPPPLTGQATGGLTLQTTLTPSTPLVPKIRACSESAPSESWVLALPTHKDTACTCS